jgi:hypothetical protein
MFAFLRVEMNQNTITKCLEVSKIFSKNSNSSYQSSYINFGSTSIMNQCFVFIFKNIWLVLKISESSHPWDEKKFKKILNQGSLIVLEQHFNLCEASYHLKSFCETQYKFFNKSEFLKNNSLRRRDSNLLPMKL